MPRASASGARSGGSRNGRWLAEHAKVIATFAGVLVVWELAVWLTGTRAYILPAPSVILADLAARASTVADAVVYTAQPMLFGYAAAIVVGVALALVVTFSRALQAIVYPLIVFLQIVPKIAVAPLFIIWFGYGLTPKILLVFLLSFFPIVVSAIQAFRSIDPDIMDLARTTGASTWRVFTKVQVPQALPLLFTGFKVAAALSATAAVVAEFVASDRGLGYLLLEYNNNMNTPMAFAIVLVLSAMGLALYGIVELIERIAIPWHVSRRVGDAGLTGNP
jgi:NitT/TauT family transport system permease protein